MHTIYICRGEEKIVRVLFLTNTVIICVHFIFVEERRKVKSTIFETKYPPIQQVTGGRVLFSKALEKWKKNIIVV
jgi:hypothetical protein